MDGFDGEGSTFLLQSSHARNFRLLFSLKSVQTRCMFIFEDMSGREIYSQKQWGGEKKRKKKKK